MENVGMGSMALSDVVMNEKKFSGIGVGGHFEYELVRDGEVVAEWSGKNTVTNQGRNYMLSLMFGAEAKFPAWYIGIYTETAGVLANLTGVDIGGANLTQFTGYTGARPMFSGVNSAYTWTNAASKASFPILSGATIKGAFLCSDETGTAAVLLAIDAFNSGDRAVVTADVLNVTYVFGVQDI